MAYADGNLEPEELHGVALLGEIRCGGAEIRGHAHGLRGDPGIEEATGA